MVEVVVAGCVVVVVGGFEVVTIGVVEVDCELQAMANRAINRIKATRTYHFFIILLLLVLHSERFGIFS